MLIEVGVDLKDAAYKLSSTLPNVISVQFDPSASQNMIVASVLDLAEAMLVATPVPLGRWKSGSLPAVRIP